MAGIPHSSDTKHRIVRRPGQPLPEIAFQRPTPELPGLIYINRVNNETGETLSLTTKLQAYREVMKVDPTLKEQYLRVLQQMSGLGTEDQIVLLCLGEKAILLEGKDYARAADYFSRALERGSELPTTFLSLGEALWRLGRTDEANAILERGIAAYPYSPGLRAMLALHYLSQHQNARAHEVMKKYAELFPEDPVRLRLIPLEQFLGPSVPNMGVYATPIPPAVK